MAEEIALGADNGTTGAIPVSVKGEVPEGLEMQANEARHEEPPYVPTRGSTILGSSAQGCWGWW